MSDELLFGSAECDIYHNAELNLIFSEWKGIYVEGESLRKIFNELINALQNKKTSIIIADARRMMIIPFKDQEWTINDWYPRAVRAGFRYQGLILSRDTFNEITVKKISEKYDDAIITTEYFPSPVEAMEWARYIRNIESPPYPNQHLN